MFLFQVSSALASQATLAAPTPTKAPRGDDDDHSDTSEEEEEAVSSVPPHDDRRKASVRSADVAAKEPLDEAEVVSTKWEGKKYWYTCSKCP